jgi:hypothetical protein
VWFRRGRLLIVSPDSLGTACPLSGRNSTYRPVQILEAGSNRLGHKNKRSFNIIVQTPRCQVTLVLAKYFFIR